MTNSGRTSISKRLNWKYHKARESSKSIDFPSTSVSPGSLWLGPITTELYFHQHRCFNLQIMTSVSQRRNHPRLVRSLADSVNIARLPAVFMVKWSYLRVEVESGSPYYGTTNGTRIVQEDERPNGSPSSHDISYIRLTTRRGHVIIFRARLHFEGGRWRSWRPFMVKSSSIRVSLLTIRADTRSSRVDRRFTMSSLDAPRLVSQFPIST
jgi:hypothetical protein